MHWQNDLAQIDTHTQKYNLNTYADKIAECRGERGRNADTFISNVR